MTLEELDAKYQAASWHIAKWSAVAAGKALIFDAGSLDEATQEISAIYGLSAGEMARVQPTAAHNALANVQMAANGLFGETIGMNSGQALTTAKQAVVSGKKMKVLRAFIRAGPNAAKALIAGGKAAGVTAGKGTPWGWIATAAYAVGTGSWFAYNLRSFNLATYELVRLRENIVLPPERLDDHGLISMETFEPLLSSISDGANAVGTQAAAAWEETIDRGERLVEATGGLLGRLRSRWGSRSAPLEDANRDSIPQSM